MNRGHKKVCQSCGVVLCSLCLKFASGNGTNFSKLVAEELFKWSCLTGRTLFFKGKQISDRSHFGLVMRTRKQLLYVLGGGRWHAKRGGGFLNKTNFLLWIISELRTRQANTVLVPPFDGVISLMLPHGGCVLILAEETHSQQQPSPTSMVGLDLENTTQDGNVNTVHATSQ